jgi:DDE superfamily endonuclease
MVQVLPQGSGEKVWRKDGTALERRYLIVPAMKAKVSLMVWAWFCWDRLGPLVVVRGKMTGERYRQLMEEHMVEFMEQMGNQGSLYTYQDYNARIHRCTLVRGWREEMKIPLWNWPAYSPDMNPIEHLWTLLKRAIHERNPPVKTVDDLEIALQEEWGRLRAEQWRPLVESMPERVAELIRCRGGPTRF